MNPHFNRNKEEQITRKVPRRGYGRVDELDLESSLISIDLVDADWLDSETKSNPYFNIDNPETYTETWLRWKFGEEHPKPNPFQDMPTYRLEIEKESHGEIFKFFEYTVENADEWSAKARRANSWLEFYITELPDKDSHEAKIYSGLFTLPKKVHVRGKLPTGSEGERLSGIFSLDNLREISSIDIRDLIESTYVAAEYLAIYDVGQGNANALLGDIGAPTLYYDLGAGVYRNQHTTPTELAFCFTFSPNIILSHWDADHWAGAFACKVNDEYPALTQTWIAPRQVVGPVHIAFAHEVLSNNGKFLICGADPLVVSAILADKKSIKITHGVGRNRNNTGIVLAVESVLPSPRSWILTGDCNYTCFLDRLNPYPPVAIVAPHHGATLSPAADAPAPHPDSKYCRLVYSFGSNNSHGRRGTRHPTEQGIGVHKEAGWHHGSWDYTIPGESLPRGNVLATSIHSSLNVRLGGALVGWNAEPDPHTTPCGTSCRAPLNQT
ncbi:hypothetical protein E8E95_14700 [Pseudomonas sp. BN414]|uniref:hypothetical protein n=1 Tax=Pseudomonas sp. BN414 TaxID=2567888 RepID=UPI0024564920|nr:hypothetical protein [Pseudomonas sp. BN414]MDH4567930.1 hypothetical protein [Pseudomonas sp. BN414]